MGFTTDPGETQLRAIQAFLAEHQEAEALDTKGLAAQLKRLRKTGLAPLALQNTLEMLFACLNLRLDAQIKGFVGSARIPLDRGLRQKVSALQSLLNDLAAAYEELLKALPEDASLDILFPPLERVAFCLYRHLSIGYLVAAPTQQGVWRRLHSVYQRSLRAPLETGSHHKLTAYREALLLAAGQPASHTSRELEFVVDYIAQLADRVILTAEPPAHSSAVFWIEPTRDFSLFALSRRAPPPDYRVFYFSCAHFAALAQQHLDALGAGRSARELRLPTLADTPTGQGVLRRLISDWGSPGKRRFPRRRQANHRRATLCAGLGRFNQLLQRVTRGDDKDFSQWMIINESPDGYALMHLSGKTGHIHIGDVVALRLDSDPGWLVCLVRWAISENPEHIEIGLQIIALDAIPGTLADNSASVLLLSEHALLRAMPALLAPSGCVAGKECALRLVGSDSTRVCKALRLIEQNARVELFAIEG
jgi:hypothetical protein